MKLPKFTAEDLAWWITCAVILLGIAFSGCSAKLTPYTDDLRTKYEWSEAELKRMSFYLSEKIVLIADTTSKEVYIKNGVIYDNTGEKIRQIVIPVDAPGEFMFQPRIQRLAIGFDEKDDAAFNIFGVNPKRRDYYTFMAEEWYQDKGYGKATFKGEKWIVSTSYALSYLQVDLRKRKKIETETEVMKGRKPPRGGP